MRLENETPFPARIISVDRGDQGIRAAVLMKATYDVVAGATHPSNEQIPVIGDRLDTSFGTFHGEHFLAKDGADLCILGTLRRSAPARVVELSVQVGDFKHEMIVFGPRRWVRGGPDSPELVASTPEAFTEMPIAYTHAYGGTCEFNYEMASWPDNPVGMGYYLTPEQALDQPLPHIENASAERIQRWDDRPPVAGWGPYPMFWGMRARDAIRVEDNYKVGAVHRTIFNNAHPALVLPAIDFGALIRIEGLRDDILSVRVPKDRAIVRVQVGERTIERDSSVDGISLWVDAGRITVTHRAHFSYLFKPEERRVAIVSLQTPERERER